ncbi:MAG: leucine-rich repeat domain-containing protein [Bullifex sp.]|nr:leucine-rich repeat domain-containing protein [Bullifex sp.]
MKKFIIILLALMMILVSCDQQTPGNNDGLMLGSPSNSGSDYDPYKDEFFVIENGCLIPGNDYYNPGNRYWHMEEYESIEEVKAFRERVFNGMPMLKRVKLGTSIETIGKRSFADIPSLFSVEMKEGVKTIGSEAFSGNRSLEYIDALPKSLETIASDAFSNCPSLRLLCYNGTLDEWYKLGADSWNADVSCYGGNDREIALYRFSKDGENYTLEGLTPRGKGQNEFKLPDINITYIAANTFKGEEATSVKIPETVTSIGKYAFAESGLKSITIPESVTIIGDYAFAESAITDVKIGSAVESIGNLAFTTTAITEVTIPDSVKEIGYAAFRKCMDLKKVTFESGCELKVIDYNTFEQCASLENITIPEGVKEIKPWAFNGCSSLTTVTITNSDTKIGADAFKDCPSLAAITVATQAQKDALIKAGIPESIIHYNN